MPPGAEHAYRGYRVQALYTLYRLLRTDQGTLHVFVPEGAEDLAVYQDDHLVEVVQVKDRSAPLTLSAFRPDKQDSFFYRVFRILQVNRTVRVRIVTFGPVGPELDRALRGSGAERTAMAQKVGRYGFLSPDEAQIVLQQIEIEEVDETSLTQAIQDKLMASIPAQDFKSALDLLVYWVFQSAERAKRITETTLMQTLVTVGRYVSERAAHHREWFTSIRPLEDRAVAAHRVSELRAEFFAGTDVTYDHVLAGLDTVRGDMLQKVAEGFKRSRVVIIHGASGQGKSTLAYRFLRDIYPDLWRFEIKHIEDRRHALDIALALSEHARALDVSMAIYIDVAPRNDSWPELARELSRLSNVRVLAQVSRKQVDIGPLETKTG